MIRIISVLILFISQLLANKIFYVDEIQLNNNHLLIEKELYAVMKLKRPTLFMRNEFSEKFYQHDLQNLIGYYKTKGFLEIDISGSYGRKVNNYIYIKYDIKEGPQYKLKKVLIAGNKDFSKDKILKYFNNIIGKNFDSFFIRNKLLNLKKEYLRNGKLRISIKEELITENNNITLKINISEGKNYIINEINIFGLKNVKKKYIEREIVFDKDEIFNIDKIDLSRKLIFDSGLFSSVEILPNIHDEKTDLVNININVREYKLSSIEADFGFSELSAWQNNFLTPGLDAHAKWTIGNIMNSASSVMLACGFASEIDFQSIENKNNLTQMDIKFTYKTPWTFNLRYPSRLNLFYDIENDNDNNLQRFGVSHSIYWEKSKTSRFEINSSFQIINNTNVDDNPDIEPIRSIEFNHVKNKVKNIIRPRGGYYRKFNLTLFGTFLGGNRNFIKITNEYRTYSNIFRRGIIAFRLKQGYIYNMNTNSPLPNYYTFELGGQSSLRGWETPSSFSDGKLIYELINFEYRFPIYKTWGSELFIDIGRLFNDKNEYLIKNLSWNYGFGITYDTAVGPIRIEYAIPYDKSKINVETFHASILYMF